MISHLLRYFSSMVPVPVNTEFFAMIRRLDFSTFRERIEVRELKHSVLYSSSHGF